MVIHHLGDPIIYILKPDERSHVPSLIRSSGFTGNVWYCPENGTSRDANDALIQTYSEQLKKAPTAPGDLIVVDRSAESGYRIQSRRGLLQKLADSARLPPSSIVYCSQNSRVRDPSPDAPRWVFAHHYCLSMAERWRATDDYGFLSAPAKALVLVNKVRPHRLAALWLMEQRGLSSRCEITWGGSEVLYNQARLAEEFAKHLPAFMPAVSYRRQTRIIPAEIEGPEGTPLSLVRETMIEFVLESDYLHWFDRFTEKTLKPVATHRPFIVFGPAGVLEKLRELGFRTFDGVINEAYDRIENPQDRLNACLDALETVFQSDPLAFKRAVMPICAHNQRHLANGLPDRVRTLFASGLCGGSAGVP